MLGFAVLSPGNGGGTQVLVSKFQKWPDFGIFVGLPAEENLKEARHSPKLHLGASTRPLSQQIVIGRGYYRGGGATIEGVRNRKFKPSISHG